MRRFAAVLALALVPAAACKKEEAAKGLPPASDWTAAAAAGGSTAAPAPPQPGGAAAGAPANPHAGMDMGAAAGAPANPHAGMDMGAAAGALANPHAGTSMGGGPAPEQTGPRTLEKLPGGRLALGPFSLAAPAGWTEKPITSSMRAASFALPADKGAALELVIFYFGEGGAGGVQQNLDLWLDQFQLPDGKPAKGAARIEKATFAGQEGTIVSVAGRYAPAPDQGDQALFAAIVASPKGPYYFKLIGPRQAVDAGAPKVRALLQSLQLR